MSNRQHPRLRARGTPPQSALGAHPPLIAVVFAPEQHVAHWIESELDRCDSAMIQTARTMTHVVRALTEDPTPRPHVLVVDIDALSPADLMQLHTIRHQGWFGSIVGLGRIPTALRASLSIDTTLAPPFVQDQLRDVVADLRAPAPTTRIPVIPD